MSEPSLDLPDHGPGGLHPTYPPSPPLDATDAFSGALRSLSLKAASRRGGDHMTLQPLRSEGGPPTPHRGLFAPHALPNRNGSLSYDSLLNPGSPSGHACPTHPSVGMAGYHSPYLHPGPSDPPRPPPRSFSPVLGPRPREPSPVRYDNLSRTIMASIQERKDREERERLLRSQTDSLFGDSGVYDTPSSYSLQQASVLTEGPRGAVLRYGSRDDLVAGPGFGGARNPALQTSLSSLSSSMSRAPRTSSSSLQADQANNNAPGPRPGSGSHRSPARQGLPSPPGTPRSPSYSGSKAVAFIHTDLPDRQPSLAMQRWVPRSVHGFPHTGPLMTWFSQLIMETWLSVGTVQGHTLPSRSLVNPVWEGLALGTVYSMHAELADFAQSPPRAIFTWVCGPLPSQVSCPLPGLDIYSVC